MKQPDNPELDIDQLKTQLMESLPTIMLSLQKAAYTDPEFIPKLNSTLAELTGKEIDAKVYLENPNLLLALAPTLNNSLVHANRDLIAQLYEQFLILLPELESLLK